MSAKRRAARILVVDDDAAVAELFGRMLLAEGHDVRSVSDPEEGLREVEDYRPDAILLDLRMARVDGLRFLRHLRGAQDFARIPVAIVTGAHFIDDEEKSEVLSLGADLVYKPLWSDDLATLVRTLLKRSPGLS